MELLIRFIQVEGRPLYYAIATVFVLLDIALLIGVIIVIPKARKYRPHFLKPKELKRKLYQKDASAKRRWDAILAKAPKSPPQSFALAIIEADKFVDDVLKRLGFHGEHMADRLERLNTGSIASLDRVWQVHRARNELVHNPDFEIKPHDAEEMLGVYQKFLEELGVL